MNIFPTQLCPCCAATLDMCTEASAKLVMPTAGHASICLECGELLVFSAGLVLVKMTEEQFNGFTKGLQSAMRKQSRWIKKNKKFDLGKN